MTGKFVHQIFKNHFNFSDVFNSLIGAKILTPKLMSNEEEYKDIKQLRKKQWGTYKAGYKKIHEILLKNSENKKSSFRTLNLSKLGFILNISNINDMLLVPEGTIIAEMSCVDEATQTGEFIGEENLNGDLLGTVSDPSVARYMIDLPGSGALTYECTDIEGKACNTDDLLKIENERLDKLCRRIVNWCKLRNIFKFTVTYHYGCGAVNRRLKRHPEICSGDEIKTAKQCAVLTAKKIRLKALEIGYDLEVTTAFIGNQQMCKLRPSNMHNAVGTIGCLDSRVLAYKFDKITSVNFFEVSIFSDLKYENEDSEAVNDIVSEAVRNIKLTNHIATGSNGWGSEHFNKQRPYLIILFAFGDDQVEEAELVFKKLSENIEKEEVDKLEFYLIRTDK